MPDNGTGTTERSVKVLLIEQTEFATSATGFAGEQAASQRDVQSSEGCADVCLCGKFMIDSCPPETVFLTKQSKRPHIDCIELMCCAATCAGARCVDAMPDSYAHGISPHRRTNCFVTHLQAAQCSNTGSRPLLGAVDSSLVMSCVQ